MNKQTIITILLVLVAVAALYHIWCWSAIPPNTQYWLLRRAKSAVLYPDEERHRDIPHRASVHLLCRWASDLRGSRAVFSQFSGLYK